jgi:ATP-binding cassette, subfamily C (CFTR/MRP), member 1
MVPARVAWNKAVQKRVATASFLLEHIKAVKMTGLSDHMSSVVQGLRTTELELSKQFRGLLVWVAVNSMDPVPMKFTQLC